MGLSPYPNPVDAGVLCIILVNTAKSISTVKEIVWYILHAIGIQVMSWEEYSTASPTNLSGSRESCLGTSIEEFRSRIPSVNYDSLCSHKQLEHECSVCLTDYKPKAVINHLSCGHVFHKSCLEKWLKYRNLTCPNCRKHMIPAEDEEDTCPMWAVEDEEDTCPLWAVPLKCPLSELYFIV